MHLSKMCLAFEGDFQIGTSAVGRPHRSIGEGEWPSGLYSLRQVTEVKLGRVRSDSGWVTTKA